MPNPQKVYYVIQQYLVCRGYDEAKRVKGIEDGHTILHYLQSLKSSACACNPKEDCVQVSLERLFSLLESGKFVNGEVLAPGESEWTRSETNAALAAGGFELWPEE